MRNIAGELFRMFAIVQKKDSKYRTESPTPSRERECAARKFMLPV